MSFYDYTFGLCIPPLTSLGSTDGCETGISREHIEQTHSGATQAAIQQNRHLQGRPRLMQNRHFQGQHWLMQNRHVMGSTDCFGTDTSRSSTDCREQTRPGRGRGLLQNTKVQGQHRLLDIEGIHQQAAQAAVGQTGPYAAQADILVGRHLILYLHFSAQLLCSS